MLGYAIAGLVGYLLLFVDFDIKVVGYLIYLGVDCYDVFICLLGVCCLLSCLSLLPVFRCCLFTWACWVRFGVLLGGFGFIDCLDYFCLLVLME